MKSPAFGIDISDRSIELVSLIAKKGLPVVDRHARMEVPAGIINRGVIADHETLVDMLRRIFEAAAGGRRAGIRLGFSLSETSVFSRNFVFPESLSKENAEKAMLKEAIDTMPIPFAGVVADSWASHPSAGARRYFFTVTQRENAAAWQAVFTAAGVLPSFFDCESLALVRALIPPTSEQTMLLDIGARTTLVTVSDGDKVVLSANVAVAGDALSVALEGALKITLEQAEALKRKAGFSPNAENGRAFLVVQKPMGELLDEVRMLREHAERITGVPIKRIILSGGTSLTPNIGPYVEADLGKATVEIGNPLSQVAVDEKMADATEFRQSSVLYSTAIGLALRASGIRAGPGVDLSPTRTKHHEGIFHGLERAAVSLFTMAPQPKKPRAKKAAAKPALKSAKPEDTSGVLPKMPEAKSPAGTGVVDIFGGATMMGPGGDAGKGAAAAAPSKTGETPPVLPKGPAPTMMRPPDTMKPKKKTNTALIAVVVLLFLAAASGTAVLLAKFGIIHFAPARQTLVPSTPQPAEHESVTVTAVISADAKTQSGVRPLVVSRVIETDVSAKDSFPSSGTGVAADAKSSGTVTIINSTDRAFTFIATTRLLSKEGVLFRLREAASMPANGSVSATVVADKPGPQGDIPPTTFTLPGLPSGLQDRVTGKSDAAMTGGSGIAAAATDKDIASAKAELTEKLKAEALANFTSMLTDGERVLPELVSSQEIKADVPAVGTLGQTFTLSLSLRFRTLLIPEPQFLSLLQDKANAGSATAEKADLGAIVYTVSAYDTAAQTAEVRAEASLIRK